MAKRERKLDDFEESLTPTQAAIRWMKEAHQFGSLREFALSRVGKPDTEAPLYRLHDLVIPGLEKGLKGKPPEEKSRTIRRALKDVAFLYYLQLGINTRVDAETRAWLLTSVLISRELLSGAASTVAIENGAESEITWRYSAKRFIRELYVYERAASVIGNTYFNGHQVLFPDAAEILQDQKSLIESHIEGDNYEAKNRKRNRRSNTELIDLEQVRESAKKGSKELIDEFVVVAKAEALEICGEKRDSVLLVKNHLEAELGGVV